VNENGLANSVSDQVSELEAVFGQLESIRHEMVGRSSVPPGLVAKVDPRFQPSARNFLHYLALRRHDLRPLQLRLASLGLSSLGRAESHVLATVDTVLDVLRRLLDRPCPSTSPDEPPIAFAEGRLRLEQHANALLGPNTPGRDVRIMVTMPSEAATDRQLVSDLLAAGMNALRINCAHDDADAWKAMIQHLRSAEREQGRTCRVVMDLGGPKLRTGPIQPAAAVLKIRPTRDDVGRVIVPGRVWLAAEDSLSVPAGAADRCLRVPSEWLCCLAPRTNIRLVDARDSKRELTVVESTETGAWVETERTCYFVPGTMLLDSNGREARVLAVPEREDAVRLTSGEILIVTRDSLPGRSAYKNEAGDATESARIGCTIPEVLDDVSVGESIWFDDGKIGGRIERIEPDGVHVRITQTPLGGGKLRSDKGINLPESHLKLQAITAKDVEDLPFVAEHADVVELSFANSAEDVDALMSRLEALGDRRPGIVLKIETRRAFQNLPEMLLRAMQWPACGVMIARGDLAVECGFERLAEVQEEILWISEAAHVPVIWATQVLESMAKSGLPSRAEITDAAMGHRAECVMLNKGPQIRAAMHALDDILRRMQAHQTKKRAMMRELSLARAFTAQSPVEE
jgi:pyruvate kinase